MFLSAIFVVIFAVIFLYEHFYSKDYWNKIMAIKGVQTLPILGNVLEFSFNQTENYKMFIRVWKKCGYSTFRLLVGRKAFVVISSSENSEVIFKSTSHVEKLEDIKFLHPWLGDGLLSASEKIWRNQRKLLTPSFHFTNLNHFLGTFINRGRVFLDLLELRKGEIFDVYPYVSNLTLDIISESAMKISINAQENIESEYVSAVQNLCLIFMRRLASIHKRMNWVFSMTSDGKQQKYFLSHIHTLADKMIAARREALKDDIEAVLSRPQAESPEENKYNISREMTFLDLLLLTKKSDGQMMDDRTIRDEVITFMFAGHGTTASSISFCLYTLSKYKEIQEKAYDEQREIFGSDMNRDVNNADLLEMKYLERVIKETLRMYTTVPVISRQLKKDVKLPDGTELPAETSVAIALFLIHMNPIHFPNPDEFNPDRFLPESVKTRPPFSFVPFSAGPRNCLGQKYAMKEIKTILSMVLRRYKLSYTGFKNEPQLEVLITIHAANGINIIINKRT